MIGIGTLIIAITFVVAMVVTLGLLLRLLKDADGLWFSCIDRNWVRIYHLL